MSSAFSDPSVQNVSASEPDWLAEDDSELGAMKDRWTAQPSAAYFPNGPMETETEFSDAVPLTSDDYSLPPPTGDGARGNADQARDVAQKIKNVYSDITSAPLPKLITYMRVANVSVAGLMITSAILTLLADSSATLSTMVICVYVSCFGCLLCCFETHLKSVAGTIADNFGFMYNARGRFVFLVLLSTLCFGLDFIGKITGLLLVATACLNLYVIIKFPEYEADTLQSDKKGEGPDSLQSMASGFASSYARSNPDVVASALSTATTWAAQDPQAAAEAAASASRAPV